MNNLTLARRNLMRRPVRTALSLAGIALAVAVAVALVGFNAGYRRSIDESIDRLGFQVMLMAKGCPYEAATMMLKGGTGLLYLPDSVHRDIRNDPEVAEITPIFIGVAEKEAGGPRDDAGSSFTILAGIERDSFARMKPWVALSAAAGHAGGRWFADDATDEVVMGFEAAEFEQRKVGDRILATVAPAGSVEPATHEFRVVGILERTGTQDDGTLFLPIATARAIFGRPDELTIVGLKLKEFSGLSLRRFEERAGRLPEVQVVSLQQVKTTLVSLVETAQAMVGAVAAVALAVAVIGVMNTVLMSVFERTAEIGVMKALGASSFDIFRLVWIETLLLCVAGGIAGCAFAALGARGVEAALRSILDLGVQGRLVDISFGTAVRAMAAAALVGLAAGVWPAARAAALAPVEAIREGE